MSSGALHLPLKSLIQDMLCLSIQPFTPEIISSIWLMPFLYNVLHNCTVVAPPSSWRTTSSEEKTPVVADNEQGIFLAESREIHLRASLFSSGTEMAEPGTTFIFSMSIVVL